jgi:hypothetical protein
LIERLIENWLDKANERSFQVPFCQSLVSKGHTIIHMTDHNPMEMGKDIITIDSDGTPCAFQLKSVYGKKLTLSKWRNDLGKQLNSLALGKIIDPSLNTQKPHKPYIVINGDFDEKVKREIDDFNRLLVDTNRKESIIRTITKGQLLKSFIDIQNKLWPIELTDIKSFLEIFLLDGNGNIPKDKFSRLIINSLPFGRAKVPVKELQRHITATSIISASAISSFSLQNNHFAEFESWVIFLSIVLSIVEKNNFNIKFFLNQITIIENAIYNSLKRICLEFISLDGKLKIENEMSEAILNRERHTCLLGLMGLYGLWRKHLKIVEDEEDIFIKKYYNNCYQLLSLWGEYSIPQFLSTYFYIRKIDATPKPDFLLYGIINAITFNNKRKTERWLANPYYSLEEIYTYIINIEDKPFKYSFKGSSYTLESIVHLFVRTNWKQTMKSVWPDVTRIFFESFMPDNMWEYYFWKCDTGKNITKIIPSLKEWNDLKKESYENKGLEIPDLIKGFPLLYLAFLIVYPHRINASGVRWLSSEMEKIDFRY